MIPGISRQRLRAVIVTALAVLLLAAFVYKTYKAFVELPTAAVLLGAVGNASVPYSDALGPWLHGGLSYFLRNEPLQYVPRPTVALLFGSILSLTGSVAAVPVAFVVFFVAALVGLLLCADWDGRSALTATLACLVVTYPALVRLLNPEALMPDFGAMAFGLIGLSCLCLTARDAETSLWPYVIGFLLLGIAATIRGPHLLGGAAVLMYFGFGWLRRHAWRSFILVPVAFLSPALIDGAIQARYGITSNGVVALYAFYTDPAHNWSPETHQRFVREAPRTGDVISRYLSFVLSGDGARTVCQKALTILNRDAEIARTMGFGAVLATCAFVGFLGRMSTAAPLSSRRRLVWRASLGLTVGAGVAVLLAPPVARGALLGAALAGLITFAWITGRRWTVVFGLAYFGSLLFHAALGLVGGVRVAATYEPFLFVAAVSVFFGPPAPSGPGPRGFRWVAAAVLAVVLAGYAGNFLIGAAAKTALRRALAEQHTAVKISDSARLDRSLYMTGALELFYTRHDDAPVWTVRRYHQIAPPSGWYNPSFLDPVAVEWLDVRSSRE